MNHITVTIWLIWLFKHMKRWLRKRQSDASNMLFPSSRLTDNRTCCCLFGCMYRGVAIICWNLSCPQFSFKGVESCVKQDISHCFHSRIWWDSHFNLSFPDLWLFFLFFPRDSSMVCSKSTANNGDPGQLLRSSRILAFDSYPNMETSNGILPMDTTKQIFIPDVSILDLLRSPNRNLAGAHSQASDGAELPFVFAKLALAPAFTGKQPLSRDGSEWNGRS